MSDNSKQQDNSILEILKIALREETKAYRFYKKLSESVSDNRPLWTKLDSLKEFERRHQCFVQEWYGKASGGEELPIPEEVASRPTEGIDTEEMSVSKAIELAISAEQRAHDFYANHLKNARDHESINAFKRLAEEELRHKEILTEELNIISEQSLWFVSNELPWEAADFSGLS